MSMSAAFPGRFPSLPQTLSPEYPGLERRKFVGDGSPYLRCPGLVAVQQVQLAGAPPMPETEYREYLDPAVRSGQQKYGVHEPLYQLDRDDIGVPVIVRSVISNEGLWQKGLDIYVLGQWAEETAPSPAPGKGQK